MNAAPHKKKADSFGSMINFARYFAIFLFFISTNLALAIIAGAPASPPIAAQTVMITSTRGSICSGAVIGRDLVLTAAHCVQPSANYAVALTEGGTASVNPVSRIVLHPRFDPALFKTHKPSPDLAILKLSSPLPTNLRAARLERVAFKPKPGERFILAGFGVTSESASSTPGKIHAITLPAIGNTIDSTGVIMVRLSGGADKSAGGCTGDSGGPVFRGEKLSAIIGWSIGRGDRECGHVTGATLVAQQITWISATVKLLGGQLGE